MARSVLVAILRSGATIACLDRARVNTRCEWAFEVARPLDINDWPQQRHRYEDVAIAEDMAIRYADTVHKERVGSEGHGGLIEGGRLRERCMATLVSAIASTHQLTVDGVERARTRGYRDPRWDAAVLLSFACLYGLMAWTIVRAMARRLPAEDGWVAVAAPVLASLPIAVAAVQLFALWGAFWEVMRLGNGHVSSYRSARNPWAAHGAELWGAAVLIFLVAVALRHRRSPASGTPVEHVRAQACCRGNARRRRRLATWLPRVAVALVFLNVGYEKFGSHGP